MLKYEVQRIYNEKRKELLIGLKTQAQPKAFILGGQPASGKSGLARQILNKLTDSNEKFLFVNGDLYREFHPNYKELIKDTKTFSEKTQIFSNVFTEGLINDAINNRYHIIVEGTMRNPEVPLNTAKKFRENGFRVEAYVVSAPALFTEIGLYNRYQEEVDFQGFGRLADISSHNQAVLGLPSSLDILYNEKAVDKINIYDYLASNLVEYFTLNKNEWDLDILPSKIIEKNRQLQLQDKDFIQKIVEKGNETYKKISNELKPVVDEILLDLESILNELERDNKRRFKR
ncbi:toxin [Ornithobacterium rhinotracheale]|uniref:zeta toxin family protein n=1 Tax=Ornithobacterium rhinotracheale TaxID=28251 RepID=UPI00129C244E|nr:zeta toxin family protein [Ornithobacterium rhinotracheale]MRJ09048.1 toxin [Ornithobacterium rhinotracheale]UOH77820.1 zeta toxin family protein [Ornithobacterium rhinotracheale]